MNSRFFPEGDKNSRNDRGWSRKDSHQHSHNRNRFKKDFSSQEFYNNEWNDRQKFKNHKNNQHENNNLEPQREYRDEKVSKQNVSTSFSVRDEYSKLMLADFNWQNYCILV